MAGLVNQKPVFAFLQRASEAHDPLGLQRIPITSRQVPCFATSAAMPARAAVSAGVNRAAFQELCRGCDPFCAGQITP